MTQQITMGETIVAQRRAAGLTQSALAEKLGVSAQAVSQWERGETMPDILTLPEIADVFGVTVDSLYGRKADAPAADGVWRAVLMRGSEIVDTRELPKGDRPAVTLRIDGDVAGNIESAFSVEIAGNVILSPTDGAVDANGIRVKKDVDCRLRSRGGINIGGNVTGEACAEGGMIVSGSIYGNASAGGSLKVNGTVDGSVSAGGPTYMPDGPSGEALSEVQAVLMQDGQIVRRADVDRTLAERVVLQVDGSCGNVDSIFSVTVGGDCEGNIRTEGPVQIGGDCAGDVDAKGDVRIEGDCGGDVSGSSVTVNGDCGGDVDAKGDVRIGGDCGGDVSGGGVTVGGDCDGDISGGGVTVNGDCCGDVHAGGLTVRGDVDGNVEANGDVTVGGDVDGSVSTEKNVTVGGDVGGGVRCGTFG